jgi:hypothetical protein
VRAGVRVCACFLRACAHTHKHTKVASILNSVHAYIALHTRTCTECAVITAGCRLPPPRHARTHARTQFTHARTHACTHHTVTLAFPKCWHMAPWRVAWPSDDGRGLFWCVRACVRACVTELRARKAAPLTAEKHVNFVKGTNRAMRCQGLPRGCEHTPRRGPR